MADVVRRVVVAFVVLAATTAMAPSQMVGETVGEIDVLPVETQTLTQGDPSFVAGGRG